MISFWRIKNFIKGIPYKIYYGIKNLILWFPVIWNDRNWDYCFIYKILYHKLKITEKNIRETDRHTEAQRDAKNIRICLHLLNRLIKDEYETNIFKKLDEKWGEINMSLGENGYVNITRPNIKNKHDEKIERIESKICYKKVEQIKKQDLELLTTYIRKYIRNWWY